MHPDAIKGQYDRNESVMGWRPIADIRAVMVSGPTGSGKTLAVQEAAEALGLIVHVLGGDVSGGYGGVGENAATSWWDVACLFNVFTC